MIINGGSRRKWRKFAVHLGNEKDNERVRLAEVRGMKASSIKECFVKLQAMADMAGSGEKEFYYHANINPVEGEELSEAQWTQAGERLRENLGLSGQPGMTIEHEKHGRIHRHDVNLRVDLDTGKLIPDGWNYVKHEKTARQLEREFELEKVKGALVERDGPRPERRPKNWEVQRGNRSGISPQDVKTEVSALWEKTDNGQSFRTALAQRGYVLAQGDRRDFLIIDPAGHEHSLARRIAGARAADIRERLADIDRDELPRIGEGRSERKQDKRSVEEAGEHGADKRGIERAINTVRAATIATAPQEDGEAGTRRRPLAYEQEEVRDAPARSRAGAPPASWQEREALRQHHRDREKEPEY